MKYNLIAAIFTGLWGLFGLWLGITMERENKHDYQIEVSQNGTTVFDGDRKVGFLPANNTPLDSLINYDNQ